MEKNTIISMLNQARSGEKEAQLSLLEAFCLGQDNKIFVEMTEEDKSWVEPYALDGNIGAICCLYYGLTTKLCTWEEPFFDEETGEELILDRYEYVEDTTFDGDDEEVKRLNNIIKNMEDLTEEKVGLLLRFDCLTDHKLLSELYEKYHYPRLAEILGDHYYWGAEEQGIFKNKDKAKYFYTLAGEEFEEYEEDEEPIGVKFHIVGDSVEELKKLVDLLAREVGMPGNELGIYVPVSAFVMALVGFDEYKGNIISMEDDENGIILTAEVNTPVPIVCAIKEAFPDLSILTEVYDIV